MVLKYPGWRYHPSKPPIIVDGLDEDTAAQAKGYYERGSQNDPAVKKPAPSTLETAQAREAKRRHKAGTPRE